MKNKAKAFSCPLRVCSHCDAFPIDVDFVVRKQIACCLKSQYLHLCYCWQGCTPFDDKTLTLDLHANLSAHPIFIAKVTVGAQKGTVLS